MVGTETNHIVKNHKIMSTSVLQIRRGNRDNLRIISNISP